MSGKKPKKTTKFLSRGFWAKAAAGLALAVTGIQVINHAQDFQPGDVTQEFGCQANPFNCTMDVGAGQALVFNSITDFMIAQDFIENGLQSHYHGASIPQDVNRAMAVASIITPYPYDYWVQKTFSESTFDVHAYNAGTKARGLFQITPGTALEALYYMGKSDLYPNIPETQDVIREAYKDKNDQTRFRFKVRDGLDEDAFLEKILYDPMKAVFVAEANITRYLNRLDLEGRNPNGFDAYILHWQGAGGIQKLYDAALADPSQPAYRVYSDSLDSKMVKGNPSMFLDDDGKPRSIENMLSYIEHERGVEPIPLGYLKIETRPAVILSMQSEQIAKLDDRYYSAYFPNGSNQTAAVAAIDAAVKDPITNILNNGL